MELSSVEVAVIDNIKCVTFDLDDTLWPIEPTISAAEQVLYNWLQAKYPTVTATYSLEELREKRNALNDSRSEIAHDVTALRFESLMELAVEFNYPDKLAEEGLHLFREHRNRVTPFVESKPTLAILAKQFTLGAITNGNAQLDRIELGHYFNFVVTAAEVGVSKPDSKVFQQAATAAGVSVNEIVHVGDCPNTDVLGALHAGFKSIWLNPERKPWPGGQNPHAVIHNLSELLQILNLN